MDKTFKIHGIKKLVKRQRPVNQTNTKSENSC